MDWYEKIKECFVNFLRESMMSDKRRTIYAPNSIWDLLVAESNFPLIERLKEVERDPSAFRVFIIPDGGFSKSEATNREVISWLEERGVVAYNPRQEVEELSATLG